MDQIDKKTSAIHPSSAIEKREGAGTSLPEKKQSALERSKLCAEIRLKRAELALKKEELASKKKERTRWHNPIFLALLALGGTIATSVVAGVFQQRNALTLEETKARSNLIIEAIKTGNTETASSNLEFLINIGLLDDPNHKIRDNLLKKRGPVLPSVGQDVRDVWLDTIQVADSENGLGIGGVRVRIRDTNKECAETDSVGQTHCPTEAGQRLDVTKVGYEDQLNVPVSGSILLKPIHRDKASH